MISVRRKPRHNDGRDATTKEIMIGEEETAPDRC